MKNNYKVGMLITGDSKGGVKAVRLTRKEVEKLGKKSKDASNSASSMRQQIGSLIGRVTKLGAALTATSAAVGVIGTTLRTKAIHESQIFSETLGVNITTLSEWEYAASKFAVSGEKMGDIFKDVQDKIGDFAATGGGEAKDIFEQLNLSVNDFKNLSADEQLLKIGEALDNVGSRSEKVFFLEAIANDASRLLPLLENNAEGLKQAQLEAKAFGVSLDAVDTEIVAEASRSTDRLKAAATGAANELTIALAPALDAMADQVAEGVISIGGWGDAFTSSIDTGLTALGHIMNVNRDFLILVNQIGVGFLTLGKTIVDSIAEGGDSVIEMTNTILYPFQLVIGKITELIGEMLASLGGGLSEAGAFLDMESLEQAGSALQTFGGYTKKAAKEVEDFRVTSDGLSKSSKWLDAQTKRTQATIKSLAGTDYSEKLPNWYKKVTAEAKAQAEAVVKAKEVTQNASDIEPQSLFKQVDMDKLISDVDKFGASWSNAGDAMVQAFGTIGQQIEAMTDRQSEFLLLQGRLAKQMEDAEKIADPEKKKKALKGLSDAESDLARKRTQANLSSYGSIAGAASQMFSEQSKAREALHKMEQVFTIAEVALAMQRAGANALASITNQGNGDPYSAFARIAAMAALMAGLGVFSGSVSGTPVSSKQRQEEQGTGTVLGDTSAKSASITNSLDRMVELETDQYAELRQMNDALRTLSVNISGLATSLARRYGDFGSEQYSGELGKVSDFTDSLAGKAGLLGFDLLDPLDKLLGGVLGGVIDSVIGGFSSTKKTLEDSGIGFNAQTLGSIADAGTVDGYTYFDIKKKKKKFWGASSSTSYYTDYGDLNGEIERELALVFTSIGESATAAVEVLGLDIGRSLDYFVVRLSNISLKDLSAEEAQAEIEAVFSQQADLMARYLVPNIGRWQKAGEGMYETLIRVAQEQTVFNSALEKTGLELARFGDISAETQITIGQNIVELAGGLEAFSEASNTYFSEFFTEAEQFEWLSDSMSKQFTSLGLSLPSSREGFKSLVSSIDLTTEEGQKLYAALMRLVPSMDAYYDELESGADKEAELAKQRAAINKDLQEQFDALNRSPLEQQLHELTRAYLEQYEAAREAGANTELLTEIYRRQYGDAITEALADVNARSEQELLQLQRNFETAVQSLTQDFDQLVSAIKDVRSSISQSVLDIRRQGPGWNESAYQSEVIASLQSQRYSGSAEDQLSVLSQLEQAILARYQADLTGIQETRDQAQALYDEQLSAYETLTDAIRAMAEAADSLLLSDYSTLTNEERLGEARRQYEETLLLAQSGDVDAINALSGKGDAYLKEAQEFYASGSAYESIFNSILANYNDIASLTPDAPTLPDVVENYEAQALSLQEQSIAELLSLRDQTLALEQEAQSAFDSAMASLEETLASDRNAMIAKFDEEIAAIERVEAKLADPPPPPPPPPPPVVEVVVEPDVGLFNEVVSQHETQREASQTLNNISNQFDDFYDRFRGGYITQREIDYAQVR